jgi:hypothetical protein
MLPDTDQCYPNIHGQFLCRIYLWLHHTKKVEADSFDSLEETHLTMPTSSKTQWFPLVFPRADGAMKISADCSDLFVLSSRSESNLLFVAGKLAPLVEFGLILFRAGSHLFATVTLHGCFQLGSRGDRRSWI